jgi:hypothetical protein
LYRRHWVGRLWWRGHLKVIEVRHQ